jgi:hypothetical protein
MVGGAEIRSVPETRALWLDAMLPTASLSSAVRCACSSTSEPTSVRRKLRVDRSMSRTPSCCSNSVMRRLTVDGGICRRRAARTKLLDSATCAKIRSELRSVLMAPAKRLRSMLWRTA